MTLIVFPLGVSYVRVSPTFAPSSALPSGEAARVRLPGHALQQSPRHRPCPLAGIPSTTDVVEPLTPSSKKQQETLAGSRCIVTGYRRRRRHHLELFYDGRLETDPQNATQSLAGDGTGIRYRPVVHPGDASRSSLEAAEVAELVDRLIGQAWTDRDGRTRPLTAADIVVVAPYNAHVAEIHSAIERRIGGRVRVGTVDKFQGQEAPVSIFSTATSSPDELPRDMEFLYSGNRLNVAVSRARGLAIVVSSPDLLTVACRTAEQMRLVNAFCRLVEVAADQAADPTAGATGQPLAGGPTLPAMVSPD